MDPVVINPVQPAAQQPVAAPQPAAVQPQAAAKATSPVAAVAAKQEVPAAQAQNQSQPSAQTPDETSILLSLIKGSITLSDEEKTAYSIMARSMPKEKLAQLKSILEAEKQAYDKIEEEHTKQISDINKRHIKEVKTLVSTGVEKEEKESSEKTLNEQLNKLTLS